MAVNIKSTGWMELFSQSRRPTGFLASRFTLRRGNIYDGDKVVLDIQRYLESVATVVKHCTGPNINDFNEFTTKEFTPPEYSESTVIDVCDLYNRMAGVDPFESARQGYTKQYFQKVMEGLRFLDEMIQRAVEVQAAQVLQTGKLTLKDKLGNVTYELDFSPKTTHFPTVGTDWSNITSSTPLTDIGDLAAVIRADGQIDSNRITFGREAWQNFLNTDQVQKALESRRMFLGQIAPVHNENSGATDQGYVIIGSYTYTLWTYPQSYTDPLLVAPVDYIEKDKVIVDSTDTRYDMTAARVPTPLIDQRIPIAMPGRLSSPEFGYDVTPNVYASLNGKQTSVELESRPLLIPTQIDGFGCLDTEA